MTIQQKIAFLGAGNMAQAIMRGLINTKLCDPSALLASDVDRDQQERVRTTLGAKATGDNTEAAAWADVVILATKPHRVVEVAKQISGTLRKDALVISVAAGINTQAIEACLPEKTPVVRAMPNTPVFVDAGATALAPGKYVKEGDSALAESIFGSVGITVRMQEHLIDAVTGLSGSGPAYVFLILEALADAGVELGIEKEQALTLAAQTVMGAAKLTLETQRDPSELRAMVTSPGGTTLEGLKVLEAEQLPNIVKRAVHAAARRSKELGEQS